MSLRPIQTEKPCPGGFHCQRIKVRKGNNTEANKGIKSIPYLNRPGSSECQKLQQLCLDPGACWRHSPAHTTYLSTGNKHRIFWLIICWMIRLLFFPYSSFVRKQSRECLFFNITKTSVLSKESKCNLTTTLQWQHSWHPHTTEVRQVILLTVVFEERLLNYRG